jgi:hypothetical protein
VEYGNNIQVGFLPSNTTSLLQPTDQGVIATSKTYFAQLLTQYLVQCADVNQEASPRDLWKRTDIKALDFTDKTRQRVSPQTMNGAGQKLTPQFVVDEKDVAELLEFYAEEMTPTELFSWTCNVGLNRMTAMKTRKSSQSHHWTPLA